MVANLIKTQDLKTDYWERLVEHDGVKPSFDYDEELDTLFIYFSEKETDRLITHYVDESAAFLYRYSDKQVVGMRIEKFMKAFLPGYMNKEGWKLSELGRSLDGIEDVELVVQAKNPAEQYLKRQPAFPIPRVNPEFAKV